MGYMRRQDLEKHFWKHPLFNPLFFSFFHPSSLLIQSEKENWSQKTEKSSQSSQEGQKVDHILIIHASFSPSFITNKVHWMKSWGSGEMTGVLIDKFPSVWYHTASLLSLFLWILIFFFTQLASHVGCYDSNTIREKVKQKYEATSYHYRIFQFIIFTDTWSSELDKEFLSRRQNE